MASIAITVGPLTATRSFDDNALVADVLRDFAELPEGAAGQEALDAALAAVIRAIEEGAGHTRWRAARQAARESARLGAPGAAAAN